MRATPALIVLVERLLAGLILLPLYLCFGEDTRLEAFAHSLLPASDEHPAPSN
jgi:hypothetical protein